MPIKLVQRWMLLCVNRISERKKKHYYLNLIIKWIMTITTTLLNLRNYNGNLAFSRRGPISYRNQPIDLQSQSMDWFLYDTGPRREWVNSNWNCKLKQLKQTRIQKELFENIVNSEKFYHRYFTRFWIHLWYYTKNEVFHLGFLQ